MGKALLLLVFLLHGCTTVVVQQSSDGATFSFDCDATSLEGNQWKLGLYKESFEVLGTFTFLSRPTSDSRYVAQAFVGVSKPDKTYPMGIGIIFDHTQPTTLFASLSTTLETVNWAIGWKDSAGAPRAIPFLIRFRKGKSAAFEIDGKAVSFPAVVYPLTELKFSCHLAHAQFRGVRVRYYE